MWEKFADRIRQDTLRGIWCWPMPAEEAKKEHITMPETRSYHFSFGDSTSGPIGFCARINADSESAALEILQERLRQYTNVLDGVPLGPQEEEYIEIYVGIQNLNVLNIDEINETEDQRADRHV